MRSIPAGMSAAIAAGVTTFCHGWRVTRRDGAVFGFTDHDRDLSFEDTLFRAATGVDGTEAETSLGFAISGSEINGILTSDALVERDILAGLWDGAAVEQWLVDWNNPAEHLLLASGTVGDIRRHDHAFTAEIRSLAQALDQPRGRIYQAACAADLGDARCKVNLEQAAYKLQATIQATDGRLTLDAAALGGFAEGWFTGGMVTWQGGPNAGAKAQVKSHAGSRLSLWQPAASPITVGVAFTVRAGCDKQFETCRARFANSVNFRGFPQMPGNDFVAGYARGGENSDGGSI